VVVFVAALEVFWGRLLVPTVALLADLRAGIARFLAAGFLVDVAEPARAALPADVLDDFLSVFLRVFLDIRLPFVAFDGSIIGLFQVMSWRARIE
jgi:hypothetical protein